MQMSRDGVGARLEAGGVSLTGVCAVMNMTRLLKQNGDHDDSMEMISGDKKPMPVMSQRVAGFGTTVFVEINALRDRKGGVVRP